MADEDWVKAEKKESPTSFPEDGVVQVEDDMQVVSAQESWSFYREQHPLRLNDYEP